MSVAAKKGLGTGLDVLFGESIKEEKPPEGVSKLPIAKVEPRDNQPRSVFDEEALAELAESIREYGVIQPVTVRQLPSGYYQLIAGERRWRAARLAGLTEIPAQIIEADDRLTTELALVENLQRRDLDFFEEAYGFRRLIDQYGLTQEEAARKVGKTQSAVANKLRLLRLSQQNMELIRSAGLTERHARCLLRLEGEEERINATKHIIENDLNVSRSEQYIEQLLRRKQDARALPAPGQPRKVVRLIKDVRFFLNTLNRAVSVMVDAGVGATVEQQENDDGLTLTINIPHARA